MNNNHKIGEYNSFCKSLRVGNILYNLDSTNLWGEYLLVVNIIPVNLIVAKTYTVLLIGLNKKDGEYIPRNLCISLTPELVGHTHFLKQVGYCKFSLTPKLESINVNNGLVAIYGNTDLHKFTNKLSIKKPRVHKYGKDGKPVIKKTDNQ